MTAGREGIAGKMKSIEEWKWGEQWKEDPPKHPSWQHSIQIT